MKSKITSVLFILITSLLVSCSQVKFEDTPSPALKIINLQISPELEYLMPRVSQCANSIEGIGIYTDVVVQPEMDVNQTDLVLRLGKGDANDTFITVLGLEELVLIIGDQVPVDTLSIESIRGIFSGELSQWGEVPEVLQQGMDINQPIQTFSYPEDTVLRALFSRSFLESQPIKSDPILFSTPEGLDGLLQETPYGIGYLLKSQQSANLRQLEVSDLDPSLAQEYVLAITSMTPEGKLKQFLLCLQDS